MADSSQDAIRKSFIWRVRMLAPNAARSFDLRPDPQAQRRIAAELGLRGLRKLRFAGTLAPEGTADWRVEARLGATVTQDCVVTLAPVTTRIEQPVIRRLLHDWPPPEERGDEVEMPADDSIDPLGSEIDLWSMMLEALSLALPDYPRAADADMATPARAGGAGDVAAAPRDADRPNPFLALAALRRKTPEGDR
ncbi:MAG: DUF177 domain-containing protein [Roseovarius sp.]